MAETPAKLLTLIEHFERNIESYRSPAYKEAQLRAEFVNPFFEALGWDVSNKEGHAEAYKDVIHEDAIQVGSGTKAPDYCFRIGGARKFFVETKKPSVDIKADGKGEGTPAYQLRRYAWSAKLPLSILTDFEEFAIYDCRIRPKPSDRVSTDRIFYCAYREYPEKWEYISNIFSKRAVLQGSFDRFAESKRGKRGTSQVDAEFLKEIEGWRDLLARNIALRNPDLSVRELNFAVQVTIDRVIFLRMAEDRGIETYGQLQSFLNGTEVYSRLRELYHRADERYNSGLFHFQKEKGRDEPDELTPRLKIDDKALKEIFKNLYYPDSPYEFSVLGGDILGNVYEQFLGKVIRLTANHRAAIEEKPEVKKAGGVYYTPAYIVDYIVKHTVGKLCDGKTPKQVAKLTILDPACGSGSFLIGAYTRLLDWHRDWYVEHDPKKHTNEIYQGAGGQWYLTTREKKRILLNNIFGVDIDSQAVEVTKLNLLLKLLEGENQDSLERQFKLWRERALPDLGSNIKCGNSLIGPDFYELHQTDLFDDEERYRINVFDWNAAFPKIMKSGGFDAVIGNPPYVRQEMLGDMKDYFSKHYRAYHGVADLYAYFIEKSLSLLSKTGRYGMIVSNKWMRANYGGPLRKLLAENYQVEQIVDFGELPVFQKVATFPSIIIAKHAETSPKPFVYAPIKELEPLFLEEHIAQLSYEVKQGNGETAQGWALVSKTHERLLEKIRAAGIPLAEYCGNTIRRGVLTGLNEAFVIDQETRDRLIAEDPRSAEILKPFVVGDDVRRYYIKPADKYLIFTRRGVDIDRYSATKRHLQKFRRELTPKKSGSSGPGRKPGAYQWYEIQDTIDYYDEFRKPKIIFPDIGKESRFSFDTAGLFVTNTVYIIPRNDICLLGILNSKLIWFHLMNTCTVLGDPRKGGRLRLFKQFVDLIPIRAISLSGPTDKVHHDKMVKLVESMLDLHQKLHAARTPMEKTALERQIDATDRQIDALVYELYGLTDEEIAIVEEATKKG